MFENIFRGFSFIKESFSLVTKDKDLIKPSIYSIFFGILFTVITGIAIYLSTAMMPQELVYILVFLVLLGEYYISYFFTGMTAFLVYDYFKDGDATMSEAWTAAKKNAVTLFYLSIISAIVKVVTGVLRGKSGRDRGAAGGLANMVIGFIERVWTVATYFIIPAIVIEDRDLKGAVARATDIMQRHLLPIGVGEIAVGLVTGLLTLIGFIAAIVIGFVIFGAMSGANAFAGGLIAIVVAAVIIVLVIALSMYVTTAYHTCLFLWARSVEDAGAGAQGTVKPPAPIANTLGV
ncbi:MAG: hypothetical protein KKG76_11150 [Euryarchaeota archaeon]|nr:hypothetical protein [Euryarchaeota archaeon]MBU4138320.1 hypothetical protein [Euryarchaeota archaeon]